MDYNLQLSDVTDESLEFANDLGERVSFLFGRNGLSIECNSDRAGDTETGFGERVEQHISAESVRQLRDWLCAAIARSEVQERAE